MELEKIGFYTLSDKRAKQASSAAPLHRCELLLTNECNFNCLYCRSKKDNPFTYTFDEAKHIIDKWISAGLKNIRFSGGEPTLWGGDLRKIVSYVKGRVERIAISTNGSADFSFYRDLAEAGVNDFSISLDACCASTGEVMSGGVNAWKTVIDNIEQISKRSYTTVGIVLTAHNVSEIGKIIKLSHSLGVHDIRIITAAQWNEKIDLDVDEEIIKKYPILRYRLKNLKNNRNVRGIKRNDTKSCNLVMDDMATWKHKHYPCIIYLREGGEPIGSTDGSIEQIRHDRAIWRCSHNTHNDEICKNGCLDVCIDYNNRWDYYDYTI
jgi:molybdenum cofactor biosynthesis enzyme MoaA